MFALKLLSSMEKDILEFGKDHWIYSWLSWTLEELKSAGESLTLNVQRLEEYKTRLVVFPKKANKPKKGASKVCAWFDTNLAWGCTICYSAHDLHPSSYPEQGRCHQRKDHKLNHPCLRCVAKCTEFEKVQGYSWGESQGKGRGRGGKEEEVD